ncbi:uncharacterized protein LOC103938869 isoform X2 [Pyrus x bretschneideri]|uniref:uncharacterized protein LOC103938869 isoform X2 n=1 Tax=Pyrus x bretschneideri TaxID=225117 RepID=UPI00202FDB04|nr:uncharacterized protein LOC103938869 isoform X2 [Pyrus x bretschneideri]
MASSPKFLVFSILVLGTLSLSLCKFEQQRTHLCVLHFRQFRITGSDLKWGIAAVVGELDHGDAVQTFPARRFKLRIGLREREGMAYIRSDQEFLPYAHEAIPRGYSEHTV